MQEYWDDIKNCNDLDRGMFLILPLKYGKDANWKKITFVNDESNSSTTGKAEPFSSSDFIQLLNDKCSDKNNFVRRFRLSIDPHPIQLGEKISITDLQLFVFHRGIAFITIYLSYKNSDVQDVYEFVYPGYLNGSVTKKFHEAFLGDITDKIVSRIRPKMTFSISDVNFIIKEAYRLNVAALPKRFDDTNFINKITYNSHRIVDLKKYFEDPSEKDVGYVTGAKDVDSNDYGWGCSITSQEISYVYSGADIDLVKRAEDDLMLTMLVMYQKHSCMQLNEDIHQRYTDKNSRIIFNKSVQTIKREALEFIAYGTLAPSQISRWNNVCETYRLLQEMNGVKEALDEIKEKVTLLNEEQDRIDSKRQGTIGMIIAVFGLVSIIASVLQIVDYVSDGNLAMLISFWSSVTGVLLFGSFLAIRILFRKKRNGDV